MSVGIYRNRLNQEIKSFARFTKAVREQCSFNGKSVEVVFEDKKEQSLEKLSKHDTIIFVTHGDSNNLYHRYCKDKEKRKSQILLGLSDLSNEEFDRKIYDNKIIIAISCCTADQLGAAVFDQTKCKAYLGFKYKIHFDRKDKKKASRKYYQFLLRCYKKIFSDVLVKAINNEWTIEEFKEKLELYSKQYISREALAIKSERPQFYINHRLDLAVFAVSHVADNIVLYNDDDDVKIG